MADTSVNLPYTVFGTILIGTILIGAFIVYPQFQELRQLNADVTAAEAKVQERQEFLQTIDRKRLELERNSIHERELAVVLPAEDSITDLLRIIERHGNEAGVVVRSVDNQSTSARAVARSAQQRGDFDYLPAGVLPLNVTVTGTGSYLQWRQFIRQLESSLRLVDMPRLSLSSDTGTPDNLTGQVTIQTYLIDNRPQSTP